MYSPTSHQLVPESPDVAQRILVSDVYGINVSIQAIPCLPYHEVCKNLIARLGTKEGDGTKLAIIREILGQAVMKPDHLIDVMQAVNKRENQLLMRRVMLTDNYVAQGAIEQLQMLGKQLAANHQAQLSAAAAAPTPPALDEKLSLAYALGPHNLAGQGDSSGLHEVRCPF